MFGLENKKIEKEQEAQMAEAVRKYKSVFSGEDGEWVLKDLAKRSFESITTYDEDVKKFAMNEGRRSLYKYIKTMVDKEMQEILEDLTKNGN